MYLLLFVRRETNLNPASTDLSQTVDELPILSGTSATVRYPKDDSLDALFPNTVLGSFRPIFSSRQGLILAPTYKRLPIFAPNNAPAGLLQIRAANVRAGQCVRGERSSLLQCSSQVVRDDSGAPVLVPSQATQSYRRGRRDWTTPTRKNDDNFIGETFKLQILSTNKWEVLTNPPTTTGTS
jgi:hypothetical protein